MEFIILNLLKKNSSDPDDFTEKFYQMFKSELSLILYTLFPKIEEEEILPNSFYEASITPIPIRQYKRRKH